MTTKSMLCTALAVAYFAFALSSCGNSQDDDSHDHQQHEHHDDHDHDGEEHVHVFSCPMHPEVTGKEGDKCSICGMDLEHTDIAPTGTYRIDFKTEPAQLVAGQPGVMLFTPKDTRDVSKPVPLSLHQEKKMHVIIVSSDLSYFEHVHPQYDGTTYELKVVGAERDFSKERGLNETRFYPGGDYIIFVDYTPVGSSGVVDRLPLNVGGPAPESIPLGQQRLEWKGGDYSVKLSIDHLRVGKTATLKLSITKNSKPVTDLDKYLGALAHMIILSEDTEEFLHVHPESSASRGPDITLQTTFPKSGKYKVFAQFNHQGKVRTSDFMVEAKQ